MDKQTTAQVTKVLGITKAKLHHTLYHYPALRPAGRVGKQKAFLWSMDEIKALSAHFTRHPVAPRPKPST